MERKLSTDNLKIGMYVSGLDRPWLDTPFLTQGFFISEQSEVAELQQYCKYVYIDTDRGVGSDVYLDEADVPNRHYLDDFLESGKRQQDYEDQISILHEYPAAEVALDEATLRVANIMDNVKKGDNLDIKTIKASVQPLLDSMIRNTDALLWLANIKENSSLYNQALDNCTIAIAFGRHLGLYKEDIRVLAIGMLLLDVGKSKISDHILDKSGSLTRAEFTVIKKHVEFGVGMLQGMSDIDGTIVRMLQTHHERFDGSGYPDGLSGDQIPLYGHIAGIIDTYSAMTRKTPYREAIAPHKVLQELYKWRNKYFHPGLVEQFLQCLGVYPTGSLVEMTSGEVGIVIAQNLRDRLMPTINMVLDEQKNAYQDILLVDMARDPIDANGLQRKILRALKPGAFGIDLSKSGL